MWLLAPASVPLSLIISLIRCGASVALFHYSWFTRFLLYKSRSSCEFYSIQLQQKEFYFFRNMVHCPIHPLNPRGACSVVYWQVMASIFCSEFVFRASFSCSRDCYRCDVGESICGRHMVVSGPSITLGTSMIYQVTHARIDFLVGLRTDRNRGESMLALTSCTCPYRFSRRLPVLNGTAENRCSL